MVILPLILMYAGHKEYIARVAQIPLNIKDPMHYFWNLLRHTLVARCYLITSVYMYHGETYGMFKHEISRVDLNLRWSKSNLTIWSALANVKEN